MLVEVSLRAGGETDDFVCIGDTNSYLFCVLLRDITAGSPGRQLAFRLHQLRPSTCPAVAKTLRHQKPVNEYMALAPVLADFLEPPVQSSTWRPHMMSLINATAPVSECAANNAATTSPSTPVPVIEHATPALVDGCTAPSAYDRACGALTCD